MILRLALLIALVAPCCISMELESQGFNLVTDETLDKLKDPAIKTYKKTVTVVNRTYVIGISLDTREVSKITQYLLYKENSKSKVLAFWSLDIKRNAFEAFMTTSKNECDIQFKKAMDGDAILKHGLVKIGDGE